MTDLVSRTKNYLYGPGLGEKPVIVRAAADASETITGSVITFNLLSGEGAASGIAAGDVLSLVGGTTVALSPVLYVLAVSTDAVTALNSYQGATATVADALDGAIFEMNAWRTEFQIWQNVSACIAGLLWPEVYQYTTENITPDLSDYQSALQAGTEKIVRAQQVVGNTTWDIPFELHTNIDTDVAATGVYAELYALDGSTVYVTSQTRVTESSTLNEAYMQCIATGAAALAAGGALGAGAQESSKKGSQDRNRLNPRQTLWQDFLGLRSAIANELSQEEDWFEAVR
jgi:hypothetical protein